MRLVLILAGIVVALYGLVAGALFLGQRALLFPASQVPASAAQAGLEGVQDVVLVTPDGERLAAWWRPPQPGRAVILYVHGNGGGLMDRRSRVRALMEDGRGILALSYRGYSGSTGSPSELGLRTDARTAHDWVAQGYEAGRLVLYGESLGSGVAVRLAAERPVGGVILDAPFTSTADVARRLYWWLPVGLLMRDQFPSIDVIGRVKAPILILHGERDRVTPIALGERLFAAANEPKRMVRLPGGHEDNLEAGRPAWTAFIAGIEADFAPPLPAPAPQAQEAPR
ncbi:alpha/beta hydrolase [Salinarimonas soli]|uniref:Alpha/beta hydrolase n=1 Tax=Salinarimonas soli TaxID=1638099 RepID=A0A5B2VBD3_9HYPH|nr:alpha/beta hydrolase [Salinarimonas soli]KAA2235965.1 alpha/beta hydrolase [Salinarimonas soli]